MKTRILTAIICLPLLVLILLADSPVIAAAVIVVSVAGLYEFYKAVGLWDKKPLCFLGFLGGVAIPLLGYIPQSFYMPMLYIFVFLLFVIMLIKHKNVSVDNAAMVVFSMVYIPYFLTNLLYVRELEYGNLLIWLVFVGAFLTDTGAYFVGVFLGKHKLCPKISPKKTIEGAVGGVLGGVVFSLLYGLLLREVWALDVNFLNLGILGAVVSVVSQIGDLGASIIKRKYGIKDYGSLFPGHGGILDRLDSVIMVAPVVFMFLDRVGIFITK